MEQLEQVHFYIASEIIQMHTVRCGEDEVQGRPANAQTTISFTPTALRLYQIKGSDSVMELLGQIADSCQINDPSKLNLLYRVFSMGNIKDGQSLFAQHGFNVALRDHRRHGMFSSNG